MPTNRRKRTRTRVELTDIVSWIRWNLTVLPFISLTARPACPWTVQTAEDFWQMQKAEILKAWADKHPGKKFPKRNDLILILDSAK